MPPSWSQTLFTESSSESDKSKFVSSVFRTSYTVGLSVTVTCHTFCLGPGAAGLPPLSGFLSGHLLAKCPGFSQMKQSFLESLSLLRGGLRWTASYGGRFSGGLEVRSQIGPLVFLTFLQLQEASLFVPSCNT